ncbi:MAG: hypothetical protein ACAI44_22710 [Candidatus Sericytochromatia bacterium]
MTLVPISDSSGMKAEIAKNLGSQARNESTNLKVTPALEQVIHQTPYGKDGMLLSQKDQYSALHTILPNSELEKSRQELKKEKKKKKDEKDKKKKKDFWDWLFAK